MKTSLSWVSNLVKRTILKIDMRVIEMMPSVSNLVKRTILKILKEINGVVYIVSNLVKRTILKIFSSRIVNVSASVT